MKIQLSKRILNTIGGSLKERIFFLHIPKCAGTSLANALTEQYITLNPKRDKGLITIRPDAEMNVSRILNEETSREFSASLDFSLRMPEFLLLYYMSQHQVRYIGGHVPFSEIAHREFGNQFSFITILRDPVKRYISEYSFNKFKKSTHQKDTASMDIDAYLESPRGKAQGCQYVLFLGGRLNGDDYRSKEAVKRAIQNLRKFVVIGFSEDMSGFVERYQERFGVKLRIRRQNVNPRPSDWETQTITADIRRKIENICERDCEIYHHLQQLTK